MGLEIFVYAFLLGLDAMISAVIGLVVGRMAGRGYAIAAGLFVFIVMIAGFCYQKAPAPLSPQQQKVPQG